MAIQENPQLPENNRTSPKEVNPNLGNVQYNANFPAPFEEYQVAQNVVPGSVEIIPQSSTAGIAVPTITSMEEAEAFLKRRELDEQEDLAAILRAEIYEDPQGNLYRDYGSFESIVNLRDPDIKIDINEQGEKVYSNVMHQINHNPKVVGNDAAKTLYYMLPPNQTKTQLYETILDRNNVIRNTGDLTYDPDRQIATSIVGRFVEETVGAQGVRGALYGSPIALGVATGKLILGKKSKRNFMKMVGKYGKVPTATAVGLATTGLGYYLLEEAITKYGVEDPENLDNLGWARMLFDLQEFEIEQRRSGRLQGTFLALNPDEAVRTFTVEQYAALMDPKYATWWVKFANTATEGVAASLTFGIGTGSILFRPRNAKIIKSYQDKAITNIEQKNLLREKGSRDKINYDLTTKEGRLNVSREVGNILDREKEEARNYIAGSAFRFIHGYSKSQIREQIRNPRKYWRDYGLGEFGAGFSSSLAAYYSWGSDQTEHVDKLPFVLLGATFGPWTIATGVTSVLGKGQLNPVRWATDTARAVSGIVEMNTRAIATGGGVLEYMSLNPNLTDGIFDYLQGRTSSMDALAGMSTAQIDVIVTLKEQIAKMDEQLGGSIVDGMESGVNQAKRMQELGKKYGVDITFEDSIGVFTRLDILAGMEDDIANMATAGLNVREITNARENFTNARKVAMAEINELLDKTLGLGERITGAKPEEYLKFVDTLEKEIAYMGGRTQAMDTIINQAFAYQADEAIKAIQKNPLEGSTKVQEIIDFLESPMGKKIEITLEDGKILTTEQFVNEFKKETDQILTDAYEQALQGRRPANLVAGAKTTKVDFPEEGEGRTIWDLVEKGGQLDGRKLSSGEAIQVSNNFFAANMLGRRNYVRNQADNKYIAVFGEGNQNLDISNLVDRAYTALDEFVEQTGRGGDAFLASRDDAARNSLNQFFGNAIDTGLDNYFTALGQGSRSKGVKAFSELLNNEEIQKQFNKAGVKLTADMLSDPRAFAKALVSGETLENGLTQRQFIANILEGAGVTPFKVEMPNIEYRYALSEIKNNLNTLNIQGHQGNSKAKQHAQQGGLINVVNSLANDVEIKVQQAIGEGKQGLLDDANNYYATVVKSVTRSAMWKNTMGTAVAYDPTSVTGWKYSNGIDTWIEKEMNKINSVSTANDFWTNFYGIFGKDTTDPYFIGALKAIDDYMIQNIQGAKKFDLKFSRRDKSSAEVTEPEIVRTTGMGVGEETFEAATGEIRKTLDYLQEASGGNYGFGGTIDLFNKLNRAALTSKNARQDIKTSLTNVANLRVEYESDIKYVQGQVKTVNKILQDKLGNIYKARGSFAQIMNDLIETPDVIEQVRYTIIKNFLGEGQANARAAFKKTLAKARGVDVSKISDQEAAEEGARQTLSVILGRGLSERGKVSVATVKQTYKDYESVARQTGELEIIDLYDANTLTQYMRHHKETFESIMGKEHFNDVFDIVNYMATSKHTIGENQADQLRKKVAFKDKSPKNFVYGPASIISRLYAAESGRTSYRYIGAEAVAALLVNKNYDALAAIMTNPQWSKQIKNFLADPTIPSSHASANTITFMHELAAFSAVIGDVVWTSGVPVVSSPEQLFINEDAEKVPYADQLENIASQTKETVRYGLAPFFGGPEDPQMEALGLRLTTDTKKPSPEEYSELEEQQNIDRITDTTVDEFGNVVKPSREESDFQLMMMYIKNLARSINLID